MSFRGNGSSNRERKQSVGAARIPENGEMLRWKEPRASIKLVLGIETMRRGYQTVLFAARGGRVSRRLG